MNRDELRKEIKTRIDCRDFLQKSAHDNPGNANYGCPFCGSGSGIHGTGALKYHPETNTFYCNKCGKSGDVLDLIQYANNCDYNGALEIGANILGIDPAVTTVCSVSSLMSTPENREEYNKKREQFLKWYAGQNNLELTDVYDYSYGDYHDGLAKVRFIGKDGGKTFRWIHDDATMKSGFKLNHEGCPNRLYVKGDLSEKTCFMTEGEKDALTVYGLYDGKFASVSVENGASSGNAGNKWKPEYNSQLKGMDVYILCDNDDAGRNFARIEAMEVEKVANAVYLLDITDIWPDCPDKGDITDMVNTLGKEKTRSMMDELVRSAAIYSPVKNQDEPEGDYLDQFFKIITSETFKPYVTGLPFFDDLIEGGIMPQSLVLLMASPSAGKTTFCQQMAEAMASFKRPVIFLNLEMSREQMLAKTFASRINKRKSLAGQLTALDILKGYQWPSGLKEIVQEEIALYRKEIFPYLKYNPDKIGSDIGKIGEYLQEIGSNAEMVGEKAPAVILDYLHMVTTTQKMDNAELIKQTVKMLKDYAVEYNTFALGILATNRASNGKITLESGRDSSNLEYSGDYVLSLEYQEIDDGTVTRTSDTYNEELAELQQANPRKMIMRVLKHRLGIVGKSVYLNFNPGEGYFYPDSDTTNTARRSNIPIK